MDRRHDTRDQPGNHLRRDARGYPYASHNPRPHHHHTSSSTRSYFVRHNRTDYDYEPYSPHALVKFADNRNAYYDQNKPHNDFYDDHGDTPCFAHNYMDHHSSDGRHRPYHRCGNANHRNTAYQADEAEPHPHELPAGSTSRHGHNAEHDRAHNGQHSRFLLVSGLDAETDEKALAAGMIRLYKADADGQPAGGTGPRPTGLKPTSVPTNPGAKKDSLKRVFLVREKKSRQSCGYGLAEFHSKEDATAAFEKYVYEKGIQINTAKATVDFAHLGVFVHARPETPDEFSHLAGSDTAQRFEYRVSELFASEEAVSEKPTEESRVAETPQPPPSGSEGNGTDQGEKKTKKTKKRKAEDPADLRQPKSRMTISAFDKWKKRQAELGNDDSPKPVVLLPTDPLVRFDENICYLCRRTFKRKGELEIHVEKSQLHKKNLTDQREIQTGWDKLTTKHPEIAMPITAQSLPSGQFRDRAKERRKTHGSTKQPSSKDGRRTADPSPSPSPPPKVNIGAKLLAKAGYTKGTGLGASGSGITAPIETAMYRQGVGLGAEGGKLGDAHTVARQGYLESVQESARGRYRAMQEDDAPSGKSV